MASTTFNGPVRSENGFQTISINATTGTVTVDATIGAATSVNSLTVTGTVILSGLPTSDPNVAGAIWANTGVLTVSAG